MLTWLTVKKLSAQTDKSIRKLSTVPVRRKIMQGEVSVDFRAPRASSYRKNRSGFLIHPLIDNGWTPSGFFSFIFSATYTTSWLNCSSERTLRALDKTSRHTSLKTRSVQPSFVSSISSLQAFKICSLMHFTLQSRTPL